MSAGRPGLKTVDWRNYSALTGDSVRTFESRWHLFYRPIAKASFLTFQPSDADRSVNTLLKASQSVSET